MKSHAVRQRSLLPLDFLHIIHHQILLLFLHFLLEGLAPPLIILDFAL